MFEERDDSIIGNGKYNNRNSFESNPGTRTFGSSGWDLPAAERGVYDNEIFQTDKTLQSERLGIYFAFCYNFLFLIISNYS